MEMVILFKSKYSSEEKSLLTSLKKIHYNSRPTIKTIEKYYEENKEFIDSIETVEKYPSQKSILLSHFKTSFSEDIGVVRYKLPDNFKIADEDLMKSIRLTCVRLTKIIRENERFSLDEDRILYEKDYSIFILYLLQENARLGNKKRIRPNNKDIREIIGIYFDKINKSLKIKNMPPKLGLLFETLLQNEIKAPLVQPKIPEIGSWKNLSQSIINPHYKDIEIEEIGFNITDISSGEKIIIKSNQGNIKQYVSNLLNKKDAIFIDSEKFDLSYIDYMRIRFNKKHTNYLKFTQTNSGLLIENKSKNKDSDLEKNLVELGIKINSPIIDTEKMSHENLFQQIIIRGFLSVKESKLTIFEKIMEKLNNLKLVKDVKEVNLYKCYNSMKCWHNSAFRTKKCPFCKKNNKIKIFVQGQHINFDFNEIINQLKKKLLKEKIKYSKIRSLFYNKKYELHKISLDGEKDINLFFNKKGLTKDLLKDFSLYPRPLYCINFSGEIKKFPEFLYQEDASKFIFRIFKETKFNDFFKEKVLTQSLAEQLENSFDKSLTELRKITKNKNLLDKKKKGNQYERLTANIFNYIFPISDLWGGPNLPDGIIGIKNLEEIKYIFWDAKRYDDTKLSSYAKKSKKGAIKDVQYVLESLKKEKRYKKGNLKYYLFVTSSTHKDDFNKVQQKIDEIIEKNKFIHIKRKKKLNPFYKRLKEVKFCCINIEELITLGNIFADKKSRDKILRSSNFSIIFENILQNDNYITKSNIISEFNKILSVEEYIPNKKDHKRKGLDLVE